MNSNEEYQSNYIKFLQVTRTELYYYGIHPVLQVLKNETLSSDEKIKEIQEIQDEFSEIMESWDAPDYGVEFFNW